MRNPELLLWFGLLAAPLAWTVQLVVGYGATIARCTGTTSSRSFSLTPWEVALTAVAAVVALTGQAAALLVFRSTRGRHETDPPPDGRVRFLVLAALLSNTLFLVVILLGGITAAGLEPCRQA
ncbi:MAG TPA: hypothetical protein VLK36_04470 [Gaiellaceae bacterium]|nr:hypothetical protein [Gaiellaceae bacterium]